MPIKCPKCSSVDVTLLKKQQLYICADCEHKFSKAEFITEVVALQRASPKINAFISYGYDEHACLVRQIKNNLESTGYAVWMDEKMIKHSHDWEASIEQGIENTHWVIALMTPLCARLE